MTNNDELALKLKNQHITANYYLAECQECGELMPSNRLNILTSPDDESECYCPHCQSGEINDLGAGDEPGASAWNFQQLRIEALLAERDADKKRIAELVSAIGSINHAKHHEMMIPGDDEPVYWQRKEWVEWILELAAGINLEVGE